MPGDGYMVLPAELFFAEIPEKTEIIMKSSKHRAAFTNKLTKKILGVIAAASLVAVVVVSQLHTRAAAAAPAGEKYPLFEVDPAWPSLPNGWVTGHVPSISVDSKDNIWLITRPNTVPADQKPHTSPPVIEIDQSGKVVQSWGGPGAGYDWPDSAHSIHVDYKGNVWISGSGPASQSDTKRTDDMVVKFSNTGKFIAQLGGFNKSNGNADTKSVHLATDMFVWPKTNEVFVSDGYGNRRVIVFDADTFAFKRMWGAFAHKPVDWVPIKDGVPVDNGNTAGAAEGAGGGGGRRGGPPPRPTDVTGDGPDQFGGVSGRVNAYGSQGGPTHSVQITNDGLIYVADRGVRRLQVFTIDGKYVAQAFVNRAGPSEQSVCGLTFSPDKAQKYLYIADYGNSHIVVLDRKSLTILYQFSTRGAAPGQFQGVHHIATDSHGNLYTGEVAPGARAQKFVFKGFSDTLPANALTPEQLAKSVPLTAAEQVGE